MAQKYVIFSDFDGTITTIDTGTHLIDKAMGYDARKLLDKEVLEGRLSFREAIYEMWRAVNLPWNQALEELQHITFDAEFMKFYEWVLAEEHQFTILSGGIDKIVDHFVETKFASLPRPRIVANRLKIHETFWEVIFHDDSSFGHDKGTLLREFKTENMGERPVLVFIGDGISDLSGAVEADLVFAKAGKDLEKYCQMKGIAYTPWNDFSDIHKVLTTKS